MCKRMETIYWRLKVSIKAVSLQKSNILSALPVAKGTHLKETSSILKLVLEKTKYVEYKWQVRADLKLVVLILELQSGFTKYCCFLYERDKRTRPLEKYKKVTINTSWKNYFTAFAYHTWFGKEFCRSTSQRRTRIFVSRNKLSLSKWDKN